MTAKNPVSPLDSNDRRVLMIRCPSCIAPEGVRCIAVNAAGVRYSTNRLHRSRRTLAAEIAAGLCSIRCTICNAPAGAPCVSKGGATRKRHSTRVADLERAERRAGRDPDATAPGTGASAARSGHVDQVDGAEPIDQAEPAELLGSAVLAACERVWTRLQATHRELPAVVLTLGAGSDGRGVGKRGHFAAQRWVVGDVEQIKAHAAPRRHEVMICGERLADGARGVLSTLLHEAAHAFAEARGVKDTSRQGRYHNKAFQRFAGMFGLDVDKEGSFGWCVTSLREETAARFAAELADLQSAIGGARLRPEQWNATPKGDDDAGDEGGDDQGEQATKTAGRLLLICGCEIPRKLRVSRAVAEVGALRCECCGGRFAEPDQDVYPGGDLNVEAFAYSELLRAVATGDPREIEAAAVEWAEHVAAAEAQAAGHAYDPGDNCPAGGAS